MSRRCIVKGCNSFDEEKRFRASLLRHGQAWCPNHSCMSDKCHCSTEKKLFSHSYFPKSPGLRRVWNALLQMPEDYCPSGYNTVCSNHFDLTGTGHNSQKRKVPTLNIGRTDSEIREILRSHVTSVVEKQIVLGMSSLRNDKMTTRLANTTAEVIACFESCQSRGQDENAENIDPEYGLSTLFRNDYEKILEPGTTAVDATPVSEGYLSVNTEQNDTVIRRRMRETVRNAALQAVSSRCVRPASANYGDDTHSSPLTERRRPFSWTPDESLRTPPQSGKRPCCQETPEYSMVSHLEKGRNDQVSSLLEMEAGILRQELNKTRTRLFSVEARDCVACDENLKKLNQAKHKIERLERKVERMQKKQHPPVPPAVQTRTEIDLDISRMTERRFMAIFGIRKKMFLLIFEKLETVARKATYWQGTARTMKKQTATPPAKKSRNVYLHEFLLFLMRIRLKPNVELLAFIFGWSIGRVSMVFNTWLDIFTRQLGWIVKMPSSVACRGVLPAHMAGAFPRLRCIIDCTELYIQSPQSTADQVATYSNYKKHNTVKVLVAVLGNGFIGFISTSWGGRTSDNYVFKHCGLLEMLQSGDQILADRGFTISDELIRRGIEINIPPAATGVAQFPTEAVAETKRIANVRIHVERAIGRMKTFHILNGVLPLTLVPVVDKIFKSVAMLVNLQDELVR